MTMVYSFMSYHVSFDVIYNCCMDLCYQWIYWVDYNGEFRPRASFRDTTLALVRLWLRQFFYFVHTFYIFYLLLFNYALLSILMLNEWGSLIFCIRFPFPVAFLIVPCISIFLVHNNILTSTIVYQIFSCAFRKRSNYLEICTQYLGS